MNRTLHKELNTTTVSISILDKEYQINCLTEEQEHLKKAADYLDETMKRIRSQGKLIGLERIALMAGLNLANDLLTMEEELMQVNRTTKETLHRLIHKVDLALDHASVLESGIDP